jgi:hypothetical protein
MNFSRIAFAALVAFGAYFILGGLLFGLMPFLRIEFQKYPAVYRPQEGQMSHLPVGMAAMFLGNASACGDLSICSFVVHNYVNLNIGLKLSLEQGAAYFVEWLVTGIVIGVIYRPLAPC